MTTEVVLPTMEPARDIKEFKSTRYPAQIVWRPEQDLIIYEYGVVDIRDEIGRFHPQGFDEKAKKKCEDYERDSPERLVACRRLVHPVERIPAS